MANGKHLNKRQLENGMDLNYYDISRRIAGDRWLVELKCEVSIPLSISYFDQYQNVGPELLDELKKNLGQTVVFSTSKARNFVSEENRDNVLNELVEQVDSTIFGYLNNPKFPEKMCVQKIEKTMQKLETEKAMINLTNQNSQTEEDEGPADFSFCFKD